MSIYSTRNTPPGFYVYAYLRQDGTPYYIGKGKKKRAWDKHNSISLPKNNKKIVIMEKNLTEIGAFALERFYIKWYGRKNDKSGILRNLTDGGQGGDTISHHPNIEKIKKNISEKNSGKNNPMYGSKRFGEKNPFYGKKHSEETKIKIAEMLKGKTFIHTEDTIKKISDARKKTKKLECRHCGVLMDPGNFKKHHGDNCKKKVKTL